MKISKRNLLALSGLFTVMGLCLMTVSIADRQLYIDLNHAVQYMGNVKFVSTGSKDFATLKQTGSGSVKITTPNFILTQTGIDKENIILTGSNSTILGGIKNTIDGSGENVIFGGSENSIKGEYNVILGGEGNSIEDNKTASVILGGKNNRVEGENVVVLGSNNTIENDGDNSKYSIIVGMSGYLKGKNSAALGLNSKVEANNSFLWNDGNGTEKLMGNNLFAVIASSGMIINTGKAHNLAKLTLGGPLIISSRDNDKNIKCGTGNGGGILKVVNSENQLCLCSCDGSGRNSMLGKGVCMSICDSSMKPECGTIVTRIVTGGFVNYSGSCDFGRPIKGPGAYLVTKDNKVHRSCQTDDGQVVGCSGTASNLPYNNCGGTHPEGEGVIIGGSSFIQGYWEGRGLTTWSYTGVLTPLTCEWTCDTTKGYHLSEDGTSCTNTYSCRGTVQLTGTIRGSSTTTNPNQEWSYTESSTPGSCEWTCDSANNYYRNGEICVRGYSCAGEAPGANTIPGSNTTTNPNQEWSYTGSSTPGSCEWTCETGYILDPEGNFCTPESSTCSSQHFDCENGTEGSEQNTGDIEWTWKCGERNCKECRTDMGYYDSGGICEYCTPFYVNVTSVSGCVVKYNIAPYYNSSLRTGNILNLYYSRNSSVFSFYYYNGITSPGATVTGSVVPNGYSGPVYFKVWDKRNQCFGRTTSTTVGTQNCSSSSSSCSDCPSSKVFYNKTCLDWEYDILYRNKSGKGDPIVSISTNNNYNNRFGRADVCGNGSCTNHDCEKIKPGYCCCSDSADISTNGNNPMGCPGQYYFFRNSNRLYQEIANKYSYDFANNPTVYIPTSNGQRCELSLQAVNENASAGGVLYYVSESNGYKGNLTCS